MQLGNVPKGAGPGYCTVQFIEILVAKFVLKVYIARSCKLWFLIGAADCSLQQIKLCITVV